jgi:hypothetical protein
MFAEAAERSCKIFWGGDRRGKECDHVDTLKRFARAVGIDYRTMSQWVRTKKLVFENLSDVEKMEFKYTAASKVADHFGIRALKQEDPPIGEIVEAYRAAIVPDTVKERQKRIQKYLSQVCFFLTKQAAKLSEAETEEFIEMLRGALAALTKTNKIRKGKR